MSGIVLHYTTHYIRHIIPLINLRGTYIPYRITNSTYSKTAVYWAHIKHNTTAQYEFTKHIINKLLIIFEHNLVLFNTIWCTSCINGYMHIEKNKQRYVMFTKRTLSVVEANRSEIPESVLPNEQAIHNIIHINFTVCVLYFLLSLFISPPMILFS